MRPGGDSNPCMVVLQTTALPLRHLAMLHLACPPAGGATWPLGFLLLYLGFFKYEGKMRNGAGTGFFKQHVF